jgi:hypothetical protein
VQRKYEQRQTYYDSTLTTHLALTLFEKSVLRERAER